MSSPIVNSARLAVFACVAMISLLFSTAHGQSDDLEAFVDNIAARYVGEQTAGLSVGVARSGEILLKKSYGLANLQWQVPMPMDAVHEVGSITKQFAAAAILQLHGQEQLSLDADIGQYLPEFNAKGRSIPLRRLLDHTSGIKGFTEIPEFGELSVSPGPREKLLDVIDAYPFDFEPGDALIYNNTAYFLLGLVVEKVSGQPFEEYVEEHLFAPAGMSRSSYCSNSQIVAGKAQGYQLREGRLELASYHDHTWPYSAGSICSTVSDLLNWNQTLHEGELLTPTLYQEMITPQPLNDGTPVRYAMGVTHYEHATGRVIDHGGGIDGFRSFLRHYPESNLDIVVLLNSSGPASPGAITDEIAVFLIGQENRLATQALESPPERFAGRYSGPARGVQLEIEIALEDDGLTSTLIGSNRGEPSALRYIGDNTFADDNTRLYFESPENDRFRLLRYDTPTAHYVLRSGDD